MKQTSWIRRNWLLVAGLTFIGVHFSTYFLQIAAKHSAKSQIEYRQKNIKEIK
ncbi:uncharacterized protein ACOB8E_014993 isoform 1-T2 [Sarcophilus harrisii]